MKLKLSQLLVFRVKSLFDFHLLELILCVLLLYQKKYRQQPCNFKHTSVVDSPDIVHAKLSGQITNEVGKTAAIFAF